MRYSLLAPGKRLRPLLVILAAEACGGSDARRPARRLCRRDGPHLFADPRRPAGDGRRRPAPRPADLPQEVRRGPGDPGRRRPADAGLRGAGRGLSAGDGGGLLPRAGPRGRGAPAWSAGRSTTWPGRRAAARHRSRSSSTSTPARPGRCSGPRLRLGVLAAQGERPAAPIRGRWSAWTPMAGAFGLAFQITDDLLDVEGSAEQTGKRVRKDAARGKLTYPGFLGVGREPAPCRATGPRGRDAPAPLGPAGDRLAALARSRSWSEIGSSRFAVAHQSALMAACRCADRRSH